jgi:hydroxyacylglutathione hydrolase
MNLKKVLGNTWVLEGDQLIPVYLLSGNRCILLDTGMEQERDAIESALQQALLTPVGILGTHIHNDHSPNHSYFQATYHIPLALPMGEAGLCSSVLALKAYLFMLSPDTTKAELGTMECQTDVLIRCHENSLTFCGAEFQILHTPGHSPDHISLITPDNVCYVGDALLDDLTAKLPYSFSQKYAMESMERLRQVSCDRYILAHGGVYNDLSTLINGNLAMTQDRALEIAALVNHPMTMDEIILSACRHFSLLSSKPQKAALFERNIRSFVEYLLDEGTLTLTATNGMRYYLYK